MNFYRRSVFGPLCTNMHLAFSIKLMCIYQNHGNFWGMSSPPLSRRPSYCGVQKILKLYSACKLRVLIWRIDYHVHPHLARVPLASHLLANNIHNSVWNDNRDNEKVRVEDGCTIDVHITELILDMLSSQKSSEKIKIYNKMCGMVVAITVTL